MPTSPETTPNTDHEIETVFGDVMQPAEHAAPAPNILAEWRRVGAFLKWPTLDVSAQDGAPLRVLLRIYALDLVMMLGLIIIASIVVAAGVELPRTALAEMEIDWGLAALVIIGAPLLEELIFRSWLSGRAGWLVAVFIMGVAGVGALIWGASYTGEAAAAGVGLSFVIGALCAVIALIVLRKRATPRWFATIFPGAFWLSTIAFALVHVFNFDDVSILVVLPLVIPQFVLGALSLIHI